MTRSHQAVIAALGTLAAVLVTFAAILGIFYSPDGPRYHVDVDVYRTGAQHILHGHSLYDAPYRLTDGSILPFTYPPLAAILFTPLALMPLEIASASIIGVSLLCVLAIVLLAFRLLLPHNRHLRQITPRRRGGVMGRGALPRKGGLLGRGGVMGRGALLGRGGVMGRASPLWLAAPLAILIGPVWATLGYGQINLILTTMVLIDLVLPHKRRGILTGTAAAIKLTPLTFGLWFLVQRDWKGLGRMLGAAGGLTAAAAVVLPHDSAQYWGSTLRDTGRIGDPYYPANQSLKGMLWRLGIDSPLLWLALSVFSIIIVALLMRRLLAAGDHLEAVAMNGILALIISPVSWAHHWIWAPVLMLAVVLRSAYYPTAFRRACRGFSALGVCCFLLEPQAFTPIADHWNTVWHLFGNSYLWWSVASIGLGFAYARGTTAHTTCPDTAKSRLSDGGERIL